MENLDRAALAANVVKSHEDRMVAASPIFIQTQQCPNSNDTTNLSIITVIRSTKASQDHWSNKTGKISSLDKTKLNIRAFL